MTEIPTYANLSVAVRSQKDFAYAGESQQNRLEQAQKSEDKMLTLIFLIVGLALIIGYGFSIRQSNNWPFSVYLLVVGASSIFISGVYLKPSKGILFASSNLSENNLYLVGPTTNVVCLIPAKLNSLTAIVEPGGSPRYYKGVEMETNWGPVVAIKIKNGKMVLKPFPLKGVKK